MLDKSCFSEIADEELLSAFVPIATVRELISQYGTVQDILLHTYPEELIRVSGIGPVKARQLQYVCELAKRLYRINANLPPAILTPKDVFERMLDMQHLPVEQFRALYLNTKNGILAERIISQGTINATVVEPREIFHMAVRLRAAAIILVHNHPSGDPMPSGEDMEFTKKMVEAGKVMNIGIIDHCIIGKGRYVSLKEKGVL
jgi:DNA repair protein RadC